MASLQFTNQLPANLCSPVPQITTKPAASHLMARSSLESLVFCSPNRAYEGAGTPRRWQADWYGSRSQKRTTCIKATVHDNAAADDSIQRLEENNIQQQQQNSAWILRMLPDSLRPYAQLARLDKPVGILVLWWPGTWSIALAAPTGSLPDFRLLALFGVGSVLIRGAACTINDILDQDIDRKVARTRLRPIACGRVTTSQGLAFLALQLLLAGGIAFQLNTFSQILGAINLIPQGIYPLMKRWTHWAQVFLGFTFSWGALLGWAAIHGSIDPYIVIPLYLSSVCWITILDTIYGHQDKNDDIKLGVKSTSLYFGDQTKSWLLGFGFSCVTLLCLAGYNNALGWPFYIGLLPTIGYLWWQISTVDLGDPTDCASKFTSNKWYGAIVFAAIALGKLVGQ